jgi:2'-5' RNA ligase
MSRTVELVCDDRLDAAVRGVWARLAGAGVRSLAGHPHPTNRPHVTLAECAAFPPGSAASLEAALAALPIQVRLDRLLTLGGRSKVVALAVAPDAALTGLQAAVHAALAAGGCPAIFDPARWVPHVSLTRRLDPARAGEALAALADLPPIEGALVAARSYDSVTRTVTPL